jgi:methylated-DNA-protein-cysteine methyltransferase-like protein
MAAQNKEATFPQRVYAVVRDVPAGAVTTYGDVAAVLGQPRLARQVGYALARLPDGSDVPWHRVINAGGGISFKGEFGRAEEQRQRLAAEGIEFLDNGTCRLEQWRWAYPQWRLHTDPG